MTGTLLAVGADEPFAFPPPLLLVDAAGVLVTLVAFALFFVGVLSTLFFVFVLVVFDDELQPMRITINRVRNKRIALFIEILRL